MNRHESVYNCTNTYMYILTMYAFNAHTILTTDFTREAETAYPSIAPRFHWGSCNSIFRFLCMLCRLMSVRLFGFVPFVFVCVPFSWITPSDYPFGLLKLFHELRLLITPFGLFKLFYELRLLITPFGLFKLFHELRLLITPLVYSNFSEKIFPA